MSSQMQWKCFSVMPRWPFWGPPDMAQHPWVPSPWKRRARYITYMEETDTPTEDRCAFLRAKWGSPLPATLKQKQTFFCVMLWQYSDIWCGNIYIRYDDIQITCPINITLSSSDHNESSVFAIRFSLPFTTTKPRNSQSLTCKCDLVTEGAHFMASCRIIPQRAAKSFTIL